MGVSKIGVPQNGWFIIENPIKMEDLRIPLFLETPICARVDQLPIWGMVIPPFIGNPYNGYK